MAVSFTPADEHSGTDDSETVRATAGHPFYVLRGADLESRPKGEHQVEIELEQALRRVHNCQGQLTRFDWSTSAIRQPADVAAGTTVTLLIPAAAGTNRPWRTAEQLPGRWVDAVDLVPGDVLLLRNGREAVVTTVEWQDEPKPVYNFRVAELSCYAVGDCGALVHNSCAGKVNLNRNGAVSRFGVYEIYVNGTLHKVGKADLNRITQSSALPTRLHQQIRTLRSRFGANNVTHGVTDLGELTTQLAKQAEHAILGDYFTRHGIVPLGNIKSFFP